METQRSAIVICTKDRSADIAMACEAACRGTSPTLVIVDASTDTQTEQVVDRFREHRSDVEIHYVRADRPGTAKQRQQAAEVCGDLGIAIMHYIDDDTELLPGYCEAIEARFASDPAIAGVGGIVDNTPRVPVKPLKYLFLLSGREGAVLRSGRAVVGQSPKLRRNARAPEWLIGCAMSYRTAMVLQYRWDERLEGYSNGEDSDLGFRISRTHPLVVEPLAHCNHRVSQGGLRRDGFAYTQAVVIYCWVREHRADGMSLIAFWWSIVGDVLLHAVDGVIFPRRGGLRYAKGMLRGVATILTGRAQRSAVP
jgi:hypothetical protein